MITILDNLRGTFRQLRWKLTLSYTAVTVGALLVVVLALGFFLFSWILVPHNVLTPEILTRAFRESASPAWNHVLTESPVDTDLVSLMLEDREPQITYFDFLRLGDMQLTVRTLGQVDLLIVDADGMLLGTSNPGFVPEEAIGRPIDVSLLPGLEDPLQAALAGETDANRLFVTIEPNEEFFLVVPFLDESASVERVLGAGIVYVEALPTENDIPTNTLMLAGKSLLILLLAAGLVGAIFGAVTANGMVKRLKRVSNASEAWSRGDFSEFIDDLTGDEISHLAQRLNSMAEQLQNLLKRRQAMAISEERNRLARDLHDSAKQQALAASFQLGTAITLFERDPEAARKHLIEADTLIDSVRKELTDLILELRPPAMNGQNFAETLNEYAIEWAHQNGIDIDVNVQGKHELPLETTQTLYRIVQEALANVARHSSASHAEVNLSCGTDGVTLTIADDGCGFSIGEQHDGMGLHSMRERAESLGGDFIIESEPGQGTRISVTFSTS
jgi:two-component system, NarL family, sensor histidine kinase LiaS